MYSHGFVHTFKKSSIPRHTASRCGKMSWTAYFEVTTVLHLQMYVQICHGKNILLKKSIQLNYFLGCSTVFDNPRLSHTPEDELITSEHQV